MPSVLSLYNQALYLIGTKRLESLTQDRDARLALDDEYTPVLGECLEQGMWRFALRTAVAVSTGLPTPDHGFEYAYTVPTDLIHTYILFEDASNTASRISDAAQIEGKYLTHTSSLYVRYTSNDAAYGGSITTWPYTFSRYMSATLAARVAYQITRSNELRTNLEGLAAAWLLQARAVDAVIASTGVLPYNVLDRREFYSGANVQEAWPFPALPPQALTAQGGQGG